MENIKLQCWSKHDKASLFSILYEYKIDDIIPERKLNEFYMILFDNLKEITNNECPYYDFITLTKKINIKNRFIYNYNDYQIIITGFGVIDNGWITKDTKWNITINVIYNQYN